MQPDAPNDPGHRAHPGLHAIALIEMGKGVLALLAASAIATLGAARIDDAIDKLAALSYFDTIHRALAAVASNINPASVRLVVAAIIAYAALRLIEGWGLWRAKAWASWLGCIAAAAYLPFDIYALAVHRHWLEAAVVAINLLVVWVLARDLRKRRR